MCIYIYICIALFVYLFIYLYIYIYIYIHVYRERERFYMYMEGLKKGQEANDNINSNNDNTTNNNNNSNNNTNINSTSRRREQEANDPRAENPDGGFYFVCDQGKHRNAKRYNFGCIFCYYSPPCVTFVCLLLPVPKEKKLHTKSYHLAKVTHYINCTNSLETRRNNSLQNRTV